MSWKASLETNYRLMLLASSGSWAYVPKFCSTCYVRKQEIISFPFWNTRAGVQITFQYQLYLLAEFSSTNSTQCLQGRSGILEKLPLQSGWRKMSAAAENLLGPIQPPPLQEKSAKSVGGRTKINCHQGHGWKPMETKRRKEKKLK